MPCQTGLFFIILQSAGEMRCYCYRMYLPVENAIMTWWMGGGGGENDHEGGGGIEDEADQQ